MAKRLHAGANALPPIPRPGRKARNQLTAIGNGRVFPFKCKLHSSMEPTSFWAGLGKLTLAIPENPDSALPMAGRLHLKFTGPSSWRSLPDAMFRAVQGGTICGKFVL